MTNFVIDGTTLPGTKTDARPLTGLASQSLRASEFNTLVQAAYDLRSYATSRVFDVKVYGAKGDGIINDTAAIQAAINAAQDAGGGIVYLPPGTYGVCCAAGAVTGNNAALTISESNITILGVRGSSVIKMFARNMRDPSTQWETVQTAGLAAWLPSHAYSLGAVVLANGHEWECTVAGTSAGSGGPTLPGSPTPDGSGQVYVTDGGATWRYRDHMFVGHGIYFKKGVNQGTDYLRNIVLQDFELNMNGPGWPDATYPLSAGNLQPWTNGGYSEVTTGIVFDEWNEALRFDGNLIDNVRMSGLNVHGNRAEGFYYGGSTMTNVQIIDCDFHHTGGSCISASASMIIRDSRIYHSGTLSESLHQNNDISYLYCEFHDAINGIVDGSNTNISDFAWGKHLVQGCEFRNISIRGWTQAGAGFNYEVCNSYFEDCGYASGDCEAIRINSAYGFISENIAIHDNTIVASEQNCLLGINVTNDVKKVRIYNNFVGKSQRAVTNSKKISYAYGALMGTGSSADIEWRNNKWVPNAGIQMPQVGLGYAVEQIVGDWDDSNLSIGDGVGTSLVTASGSTVSAVVCANMAVGGAVDNTFNVVTTISNAQYSRDGKTCRVVSAAGNGKNYAKISATSSKHTLKADRYLSSAVELIIRCNKADNKWYEADYRKVKDRGPVTANDLDLNTPNTINELAPLIQAYNCAQVSLTPSGATDFNNWANFIAGVPTRVIVNANVTVKHNAGSTNKLMLTGAADWTPGGTGGEIWFTVTGNKAYELYRVTY